MRQTNGGTFAHPDQKGTHTLCALLSSKQRLGRGEQYDFGVEYLGDLRGHVKSTIFSEALVVVPAEGLRISSRPPPASHSRYPGKQLISRQEVEYSVGFDARDQGGSESQFDES